MHKIKKHFFSIILVICVVLSLSVPAFAAADSCTWGYYTITLPKNFKCNDYDAIPLYAETDNAVMQINMMDLATAGLPASTDVLGESVVLDALMETSYGETGMNYSVYKTGMINNAAYQIINLSVTQDKTQIWMTCAGVLKKNVMLLCVISSQSKQVSQKAAEELIKNLVVHDELQEDSFSYTDLNIVQKGGKKQVDFNWKENKINVTFPDNYDVYKPGTGDSSPIAQFLGYSTDEMEAFIMSLQRIGTLVYALDTQAPTEIRMTFDNNTEKIGTPDKDGNFKKSDVKAYYDGIATMQGAYSTKTVDGKDYYIFSDHENGYKVRCFFGSYEVSLLMVTLDQKYTKQQQQEAFDIISSIQFAKG